jgi:hypothetical protein
MAPRQSTIEPVRIERTMSHGLRVHLKPRTERVNDRQTLGRTLDNHRSSCGKPLGN